jgi:hypothetical protein
MRVANLLSSTALVSMLAVLMPDAAWAGTVPFINIDESVEGVAPTVTSNVATSITVTPLTVPSGEAWTISFDLLGIGPNIIGGEGGLLEPGSNKLSDVLLSGG